MKRYLCEKNVFEQLNNRSVCFKANKVYELYINDFWAELTDDFGNAHIVDDWLLGHFRELPPIDDVPRDPFLVYLDWGQSNDGPYGYKESPNIRLRRGLRNAAIFLVVLGSIIWAIFG